MTPRRPEPQAADRQLSYAAAIREALEEELARDPALLLLGEDIGEPGGVFGVTQGLWQRFGPHRVLDTPISEAAIVGTALGAALAGIPVVVEIMFGDFATLAMDQIVNQAAKLRYMTGGQVNVPLVIRMVTGTAGATAAQHSQSLEAWFTHTPGLKVVTAATPYDAKGLLKAAIRDPDPVLFFEHKLLYTSRGAVPASDYTVSLGSGRVVREGTDVTVLAYLAMVPRALAAAEAVAAEGISVEVWDPRSLVPFDRAGLRRSLARTGRLVIVHEAPRRAGFGAEVAALVAEECFDLLRAPIVRVAGLNAPVPYAPELEDAVLPGEARIVQGIRAVMAAGRP
ncbi:MAG: alpha-ketoacid dehydrogenase subunit beta [Armatimonadota bacterium]|nr:alpha-ketoacid dehydrogenase subunit beta [Armatimonadota bacterium]MDR7448297.1 alpha-ketoacid dehydrogenase subunit beta [Armatimonadota bacterium]MDR7458326.1 alpha-ketoacid dehydrogenase subunit beta [Armatimonadota bacterium]MDR7478371.1 alpha-ketoacid dehydrogenase subunit beta [Armatimonadota bacterium]MDR7487305.1 alpha-ketoacid dehydrogenase subunit beta [Armatimonadota bacterium]